jgi:hypothetical protein
MFVLKCVARNFRFINASQSLIFAQSRSVHNSVLLLSKTFSPESSPVKIVVKKKRRISSSSEEETQAVKTEEPSPKEKK